MFTVGKFSHHIYYHFCQSYTCSSEPDGLNDANLNSLHIYPIPWRFLVNSESHFISSFSLLVVYICCKLTKKNGVSCPLPLSVGMLTVLITLLEVTTSGDFLTLLKLSLTNAVCALVWVMQHHCYSHCTCSCQKSAIKLIYKKTMHTNEVDSCIHMCSQKLCDQTRSSLKVGQRI